VSLAHGMTVKKGLTAVKRLVTDLRTKAGDKRYHIMPSSLFGETLSPKLSPKSRNVPENGRKKPRRKSGDNKH
jgi:hypothetical protein